MALTPKQEAFAQAYVETSNASEAYRRSYNAENMKPESIHVNACKLLGDAKVALRVEELREELRQKHRVTVDDILRELEEARTMAMTGERPQTAAMVAATMGKAKVLGLITDKAEVTGANGQPIQHSLEVKFVKAK
jgi:phage terminase small subunit